MGLIHSWLVVPSGRLKSAAINCRAVRKAVSQQGSGDSV